MDRHAHLVQPNPQRQVHYQQAVDLQYAGSSGSTSSHSPAHGRASNRHRKHGSTTPWKPSPHKIAPLELGHNLDHLYDPQAAGMGTQYHRLAPLSSSSSSNNNSNSNRSAEPQSPASMAPVLAHPQANPITTSRVKTPSFLSKGMRSPTPKTPARNAILTKLQQTKQKSPAPALAVPGFNTMFLPSRVEAASPLAVRPAKPEKSGSEVIERWCGSYESEEQSFKSVMVFAEIRLQEVLALIDQREASLDEHGGVESPSTSATSASPSGRTRQLGVGAPQEERAAICCDLLYKVASVFGRYERLMRLLIDEVLKCVYSDYHTHAERAGWMRPGSSAPLFEVNARSLYQCTPWFALFEREAQKSAFLYDQNEEFNAIAMMRSKVENTSSLLFDEKSRFIRYIIVRLWSHFAKSSSLQRRRVHKRKLHKWFALLRINLRMEAQGRSFFLPLGSQGVDISGSLDGQLSSEDKSASGSPSGEGDDSTNVAGDSEGSPAKSLSTSTQLLRQGDMVLVPYKLAAVGYSVADINDTTMIPMRIDSFFSEEAGKGAAAKRMASLSIPSDVMREECFMYSTIKEPCSVAATVLEKVTRDALARECQKTEDFHLTTTYLEAAVQMQRDAQELGKKEQKPAMWEIGTQTEGVATVVWQVPPSASPRRDRAGSKESDVSASSPATSAASSPAPSRPTSGVQYQHKNGKKRGKRAVGGAGGAGPTASSSSGTAAPGPATAPQLPIDNVLSIIPSFYDRLYTMHGKEKSKLGLPRMGSVTNLDDTLGTIASGNSTHALSLVEISRDCLTRRYGMKSLALKHLRGLVNAVAHTAHTTKVKKLESRARLDLYAELTGIATDDNDFGKEEGEREQQAGGDAGLDGVVQRSGAPKKQHPRHHKHHMKLRTLAKVSKAKTETVAKVLALFTAFMLALFESPKEFSNALQQPRNVPRDDFLRIAERLMPFVFAEERLAQAIRTAVIERLESVVKDHTHMVNFEMACLQIVTFWVMEIRKADRHEACTNAARTLQRLYRRRRARLKEQTPQIQRWEAWFSYMDDRMHGSSARGVFTFDEFGDMVNASRDRRDHLQEALIMKLFNDWNDRIDPDLSDTSFVDDPTRRQEDAHGIQLERMACRIQNAAMCWLATREGGTGVRLDARTQVARRCRVLHIETAYRFWKDGKFTTSREDAAAAESVRGTERAREAFGMVLVKNGFRVTDGAVDTMNAWSLLSV